jgi:hypothetical protein
MTDNEFQKLIEIFANVLIEVRVGQIRVEKKVDLLIKEVRKLQKTQSPEPSTAEK